MERQADTLREDDDDFSQAGALVRDVMDDADRDRLVENVSGHLLGGVHGDVLERAFWYWDSVDPDIGRRIRQAVEQSAPEESLPAPIVEK